jgi:hypothetical protein
MYLLTVSSEDDVINTKECCDYKHLYVCIGGGNKSGFFLFSINNPTGYD